MATVKVSVRLRCIPPSHMVMYIMHSASQAAYFGKHVASSRNGPCVQPASISSQVQRLQEENAQLRSQVEQQCKQLIEMAETIQSRLPCLLDAASDSAAENGSTTDPKRSAHDAAATFAVRIFSIEHAHFAASVCLVFRVARAADWQNVQASRALYCVQADYEGQIGHLDAQRQTLDRRSGVSAAQQAEQLRVLEDQARKWAKKFLYKVKQAAAKAEKEAGIAAPESTLSGSLPHVLRDAAASRNGRGTLDTIDSLPSPHPSGRSGPSEPPASSPLAQSSLRLQQQQEREAAAAAVHAAAPAVPAQPTRMSLQRARAQPQAPQSAGYQPSEPSRWADARAPADPAQPGATAAAAPPPQPLFAEPSYYQPSEASSYPTPSGISSAPSLRTPVYPSAAAGIRRNSSNRPGYADVHRTYPESERTPGPVRQAYAGSPQPESARTPGSSRGSALLASVNSHLRQQDRRSGGESEMNSMLDSARSTEFGAAMGDTKSKRRFAHFNRLFAKSGRK